MDRTVKILLQPKSEQTTALHETITQFTRCYNVVCAYGWQHNEKNGVKLHHATYYDTKALCPTLVSDLLIQARVKATETLKSAFTWKAKKEARYPKQVEKAKKQNKPIPAFRPVVCPESKQCAVRYNVHTYRLNWSTSSVRVSTTQGKMNIPFTVPNFSSQYRGCKVATADLLSRNGKFWLHVVVEVPASVVEQNALVVGVDLGLNRPAVTSDRQFLGNRHWKEVDRRRFRLRRKLQSKGTKSAKRHLKKLSGRSLRFHRDCDHVLSKRIVEHTSPGATLVLENLTNIREHVQHRKGIGQRRMHGWSFAQLYSFVAYKGQERGIRVERIDPRHTSQTCSKCGHQARTNRRSQSVFHCRSCHYELHADLNAAYNIREKYVASLAQDGTPVLSGSPCQAASRSDSSESGTSPQL